MVFLNLNVQQQWTVGLMMILMMSFCGGFTDPRDVFAINSLYAALGSPQLPGWTPLGGDPFWMLGKESLTNANLGGELGTKISVAITLEVPFLPIYSNNEDLFLSDNQFTGSIPDLSVVSQLTDLSLNKNKLTGGIPDSFHQLQGLINLDLAENNMTGSLPQSMGNLSSLLHSTCRTSAHRTLSKYREQSISLYPKLLSIPNFRGNGNPFNSSVVPSPPSASPALVPPTNASLPGQTHKKPQDSPSASDTSNSSNPSKYLKPIVSAAVAVLILLAIILGTWFCIGKWCKKRQHGDEYTKGNVKPLYEKTGVKPKYNDYLPQTHNQAGKVKDEQEVAKLPVSKDAHSIDMTVAAANSISAKPVPPPRHYSNENITLKPIMPILVTKTQKSTFPSSVKSFTIASLQQYTDSFSEENLIGEGMIGSVYRAELPDGKLIAVKKLNSATSKQQSEDEFAQLVSVLSNIQHESVVKLVGYCFEYGQRLIIYEYCSNTTLYDALHLEDETHKKLSWNARIRIALRAAKALEYMHEPISSLMISLTPNLGLWLSAFAIRYLYISGGYGAPELELGAYTQQSDVFSFGVVMLELLTGRKSYDSTRPRGEQFLVRWAIPQLHDIDALAKMVDPSLHGSYPSKSLSRFADIISLCVQAEPEFRPPMSEIAQDLLNMIQRES
ncbi:Protein STRUBBELIG-RECEPTOR FAMILY 3 [Bienertia sinuspersici]